VIVLKSTHDSIVSDLMAQCDKLAAQRDNVIDWFQSRKVELTMLERKEQRKTRPNPKEIARLQELRYSLAEIQNRLIDEVWI